MSETLLTWASIVSDSVTARAVPEVRAKAGVGVASLRRDYLARVHGRSIVWPPPRPVPPAAHFLSRPSGMPLMHSIILRRSCTAYIRPGTLRLPKHPRSTNGVGCGAA